MTTDIRRARVAFLWVGVIVPLLVIAVSALVIAAWLPQIPAPAAIHWAGDRVDGFAPGWTFLAIQAGLGGGMVLASALLVRFAHRPEDDGPADASSPGHPRSPWSVTARFLGALNLGLAGLMSVAALAAVGARRGVEQAMDAPNVGGPAALAGFSALLVLTTIGWFAQPSVHPAPSGDIAAADALGLAPSERVIWIGTATVSRAGRGILGGLVVLVFALAAVLIGTGTADAWAAAILIATAVLLLVAFLVTLVFRVRIGANGLRVRSAAGWPTIEIPASDVTAVRAVTVSPFGDFGGWGLRHGLDGRSGVVLRAGDALEVTRTDGRRFVVTIDDAETAASVLATAARATDAREKG